MAKKKIFAISGSTRANASNQKILELFATQTSAFFDVVIFEGIDTLPHFNPDLDTDTPPPIIVAFLQQIADADGFLICTPEYVFSLPGSLKNAIEWCVSTTVFAHKPTGLITASALGEKGQEQLVLIMKTVQANFTKDTTLLIQGVKGKINSNGTINNPQTLTEFEHFITAFRKLLF